MPCKHLAVGSTPIRSILADRTWRPRCLQNTRIGFDSLVGCGVSSNGRTLGFEPNYLGSTPRAPMYETRFLRTCDCGLCLDTDHLPT